MKILVVFYSKTGNLAQLAQAISEGASTLEGTEVLVRRVDDLAPESVIIKHPTWAKSRASMKAKYAEPSMDDLTGADAICFGTPTRYGNTSAELKNLIDKTGTLWAKNRMVNKVASVFTSASTPHGGHETTCLTLMAPLIHLGMIIVAPGYADPIMYKAGSPYGACSVSGPNSDTPPTENDLAAARFQGKRVAEVTKALVDAKLIHH